MKIRTLFPVGILVSLLFLCGCTQHPGGNGLGQPVFSPGEILKNGRSLLYYKAGYLKLAVDYTAYDTASQKIGKAQFLQAIASGQYLPLRLVTTDSSIQYKLYRIPAPVPLGIWRTLQYYGDVYYKYYKREGEQLPAMNFRDVNGKLYNEAAISGKIVILKCWFVHCTACVQEMPRLNQLQKELSGRDDILFLSVAFDTKEQLTAFLEKTPFNYAVIPVPKSYIKDTLKVTVYPTHFIVNKKGIITKVADNADDLIDALHEQLSRKEL